MKLCDCGCGRPVPDRSYYGKVRRWATSKCFFVAQRKFKDKPPTVTCACGCGHTFPGRTKHGRPRRWFKPSCRNKTSVALSPQAQQNKRDREQTRRTKKAGRICEYCGRDDMLKPWGSGTQLACENCRRQMAKHKCTACGGPFYIYAHKPTGRPAGCVARCQEIRPSRSATP